MQSDKACKHGKTDVLQLLLLLPPQGRVWSGERALKVGLVDALGGLSRAVAIAKKELKLGEREEVSLVELSQEASSPLALLSGGGAAAQALAPLLQARASFFPQPHKASLQPGKMALSSAPSGTARAHTVRAIRIFPGFASAQARMVLSSPWGTLTSRFQGLSAGVRWNALQPVKTAGMRTGVIIPKQTVVEAQRRCVWAAQAVLQLCGGAGLAQALPQALAAAGGALGSLGSDGRPLALMPDIRVRTLS
jgi:hypothetical protein